METNYILLIGIKYTYKIWIIVVTFYVSLNIQTIINSYFFDINVTETY